VSVLSTPLVVPVCPIALSRQPSTVGLSPQPSTVGLSPHTD